MIIKDALYGQRDVEIYKTRIQLVEQEVDFERKTFGHVCPHGNAPRVSYLLDDLRILKKQLAEISDIIQQAELEKT